MEIAVYPGSFNPLHIGHLAILEYLTHDEGFDSVYLIVSPKNPIKTTITADSALERYQAAVEAVRRHPGLRVRVDDIELNMPPPQYTIRTLEALSLREPENRFTLIMGADNLCLLRRWREYRKILTEYGVAVYPREGYDEQAAAADLLREEGGDKYCIRLIKAPIVDISSTEIREGLASGRDMSEYLM